MVRVTLWAAAVGVAMAAATAFACSVPVYRYALERWSAAPYDVYVFHRGPLSAEDQKIVENLRSAGLREGADPAVAVHVVDLASLAVPEAAMKMWQRQPAATAPWLVVRYPAEYEVAADLWAGPLTADAAAQVLVSPARRQIAKRILEGEAGVFLVLASGDRAKDDAAAELLRTQLARLEKSLKLPVPEDGQWGDPVYDKQGPPAMRLAFSTFTISRTDPAEAMFVRMLLGVAAIPGSDSGPVVFPFFGRGRALAAMAGDALDEMAVENICEFFAGPCSCIVKGQNPGIDMLMAVDWAAALDGQESAIPTVEPPPLAGLAPLVGAKTDGEAAAAGSPLMLNLLLAAGAGLVIAAVAGVVLMRRKAQP